MELAPEGLEPLLEESRRYEAAALLRLAAAAWRLVLDARGSWGAPGAIARDPEPAARVIASAAAIGAIGEVAAEVDALVGAQRRDGGFASVDAADGGGGAGATGSSGAGLTALCATALVGATPRECDAGASDTRASDARAHVQDRDRAVRSAVDLVLASQDAGGAWPDAVAGSDRATARALALLAATAVPEASDRAGAIARARRAGMRALLARQRPDGSWVDGCAARSGIEATAETLLAALAPHLRAPGSSLGSELDAEVALAAGRAAAAITRAQESSGAFDGEHVAGTIACTRGLLSMIGLGGAPVDGVFADAAGPVEDLACASERGVAWVLAAMSDDGWVARTAIHAGASLCAAAAAAADAAVAMETAPDEAPHTAADAAVTAEAVALLREYGALRYGELAEVARGHRR